MKLLLIVALLLSASQAKAGDWRFFYIGRADKTNAVMFIDVQSLQRRGQLIRYWVDVRLSHTRGTGRYQFNRTLSLEEVDCAERKFRTLSSNVYMGTDFRLDMEPSGKWEYAAPDTNKNGQISKLCAGKWGDKGLDRDRAATAVFEGMEQSSSIEP